MKTTELENNTTELENGVVIVKGNFKVIGLLPFNFNPTKTILEKQTDNAAFNEMQSELKKAYGEKNVWFDREITNDRIVFITNLYNEQR